MIDCMRSLHPGSGNKGDAPIPPEMVIGIPRTGLPCSKCVLLFAWEAQHVTPHEFYNNCADVRISDGGSDPSPAPAPSPSSTNRTSHSSTQPPSQSPATPRPTPSKTPKPKTLKPKTSQPSTASPTPQSQSTNGTSPRTRTDAMKVAMDNSCELNCWNDRPYCPDTVCMTAP
ncbi:TPA: hypothetical protein N0F65_002163 [Lagenidium giganteum]|uniref:Chitin-binding type-4 domain-containing protein n=1 Tax=Lagenidium giganteum TaxID=4803 RepID=A0AAV2YRT8_9STRA|nr:TPA: hypothetical protein N0F65_002163 [Lagenidium giganteum]